MCSKFRTADYMWEKQFDQQRDFLLSTDERPNSQNLLRKTWLKISDKNAMVSA